MDSTTSADWFTRMGALWTSGKTEVVDELLPADIVYHLAPFPDQDVESLKAFAAAFNHAFPDFDLTLDETVSEGSTTTHLWHCSGTYTGDAGLFPVGPTGLATEASGTHVVHWKGERPVEVWHHGDWLGWLQKCGVLPPLG
jgi:hypothetical protein